MMTTLLEEERNAKDYDSSGGFQPCLEFFMQQKIMETLCLLGEKDVSIELFKSNQFESLSVSDRCQRESAS